MHTAHVRGGYTLTDLERLGARHRPGFSLAELMDRLEAVELRDDAHFFDYGMSESEVQKLRVWASNWVEHLRQRAASENTDMALLTDGPDWDRYLEQ